MPDYTMPYWSKHAGEDISDVPRKYLEWLLEWIEDLDNWDDTELYEAAEEELAMRDRSYIDF